MSDEDYIIDHIQVVGRIGQMNNQILHILHCIKLMNSIDTQLIDRIQYLENKIEEILTEKRIKDIG